MLQQLLTNSSDALLLTQVKLMTVNPDLQGGVNAGQPKDADGNSTVPTSLTATFGTIADVLIFLTGALAVIVLIFGGLRYVTSTGDAARVKQAKDTIMYGVVGVVVAILAYAIVNFVVDSF